MLSTVPPGWTQESQALTRTLRRADFVDALALVLEVGKLAENADHHPDIDIRYRNVQLTLTTHSAGNQVTDKDFALAGEINNLSEDRIRLSREDLRRRFSA